MSNINTKFKDAKPIDTIERIRSIYKSLNIIPRELNWKNSLSNYYSVTLEINDSIKTNGKGTTKEYALASAYAESMERIQNMAPFRLSMDFSTEVYEYMGFFYSPDEKCMTSKEFLESGEDWIATKLDRLKGNEELIDIWKDVSYEDIPCDFIAQPFMNLSTGRISHIPVKMLSKLYMSNGMCAGNTREEAIVQGISEVFERYVNKEILVNNIVPPTIPLDKLEDMPNILSMIDEIESTNRYKVILKDCSLGKSLPVVGVILIDRVNQSYFVKFGCHPSLMITIERTLTELLQGQDISNMKGLKEFCIFPDMDDEHKNMINILVNGSGYYPFTFFKEKGSYELSDLDHFIDCNNVDMLKHMMGLIDNLNLNLYVRDVSFLGFPSYHVIIPGISEVEEIDSVNELKEYTLYNEVKKHIRNNSLTKSTLAYLRDFYSDVLNNPYASIPSILNLNISSPMPWYYNNITLYLAAQSYRFGEYLEAYQLLDEYIKRLGMFKSDSNLPYFKCARDFIGCLEKDLDYFNTTKLLSFFYDINVLNCVYKDFIPSENILKNYGELCCWDCDNCTFNPSCLSKKTVEFYKVLKERYALKDVFQENLLEVLE